MAQYDIILAQNVHATGVEFTEQAINLATNQLVIGNANKLPSSFANGTAKYYLRTNAGGTAPEWRIMAGTPETSFTLNEDGTTNRLKLKAGGAGDFTLTVQNPTLSAERTQTFQDKDGIIALTSDIAEAIATNDAMLYKGTYTATTTGAIVLANFSVSPNVANARGWTYKVIGVSGDNRFFGTTPVENGDIIIVNTDIAPSTTQSNYDILQTNLDGVVIGPASATDNSIAVFNTTTGKLIKDGGKTIATLQSELRNNLLSATNHLDTLTESVVRGDLIVGNATPKWSRLPKGTAGQVLKATATDVVWANEYSHPSITSLTDSADNLTTIASIKFIAGDTPLTLSGNHITGFEWRKLVAGTNITLTATSDGNITIDGVATYDEWRYENPATPMTMTTAGLAGEKAYDDNYLYICTATNTWRRIPLAKNW